MYTVVTKISYEEIVGDVIRQFRKQRGLNQDSVAKILGLNVSTFSRIENGQSALTVGQLNTICKIFEMKVSEFYTKVEDRISSF